MIPALTANLHVIESAAAFARRSLADAPAHPTACVCDACCMLRTSLFHTHGMAEHAEELLRSASDFAEVMG